MKQLILYAAIGGLIFNCADVWAAENAPIASPDISANPRSVATPEPVKLDSHGVPSLDVEFDIDSYEILPSFKANLNAFGRYLKKHPESTAEIVGHADGTGHGPQNGELARKRADAVFTYLVSHDGIDANRIKAYGTPASTEKMSNITAAGRQYDRRVVGTISISQLQ